MDPVITNPLEIRISQLQATMGKMEKALGSIDESIVWANSKGEIEWCNSSFDKLVGIIHIKLIGRMLEEVFPLVSLETEPPLAIHPFRQVLETGKDFRGYFQFGNGNLQLEIIGKYASLTVDKPVVLLTIRDVTVAKEMSQIRLQRQALEAAADSIVITDVEGRVQWVNPAFTNLTGYSINEVFSRDLKILRSEKTPCKLIEELWQTILNGEVWSGHLVNTRKDGSEYTEEQSVTPVRDNDGAITHFIAIKRDITIRKELEDSVLAARDYEMRVAAQVQESLLASQPPRNMSAFDFAAISIPSLSVDGDFYEFLPHGPKVFDLLIGDVMGKGLQAALLGAAAKSQFMKIFSRLMTNSGKVVLPTPLELITSLHAVLARELIALESFVTLVCARFDASCRRMSFVDCGHTQTMLFRLEENVCEILTGKNCPLGFLARANYEEVQVNFSPGDLFVFYSDGVTECRNSDGEMFGNERLKDFIEQRRHDFPKKIMRELLDYVTDFSHGEFSDDLSLVLVKVREDRNEECLQVNETTINSDLNDLEKLRAWLRNFLLKILSSKKPDEMEIERLILAINEATSNVILHGSQGRNCQKIQFYLEEFESYIRLTILHEGMAFSPGKATLPSLERSPDGGFGLFIIDKVFDQVEYSQESGGKNKVQLTKRL